MLQQGTCLLTFSYTGSVSVASLYYSVIASGTTFSHPTGVAVDGSANVYLADSLTDPFTSTSTTGSSKIWKISSPALSTSVPVQLGASANPAFSNYVTSVAYQQSGSSKVLYVGDAGNNMIRVIDLVGGSVSTLTIGATMMSLDLTTTSPAPSASTVSYWPAGALTDTNAGTLTYIDMTSSGSLYGGCMSTNSFNGKCYSVVFSEYNVDIKLLYVEFQVWTAVSASSSSYSYSYTGYSYIFVLDPSTKTLVRTIKITGTGTPGTQLVQPPAQLLAVLKTSSGNVLFTTTGAYSDTPDSAGNAVLLTSKFTNYKALMATAPVILSTAKVFPSSGSVRYLLLEIQQGSSISMVGYDSTTDSYYSDAQVLVPTSYMIAYTWGECSGNVTRSLVEITFSNDYSNTCALPSTGIYYQVSGHHSFTPPLHFSHFSPFLVPK